MKYMHAVGYDTAAAVTLQEKFAAFYKDRKTNWLEGLFASHPASTERVENNRSALKSFPEGGALGHSTYEERVAYSRARKGAYEEADRARQLLRQSPETALLAINNAISQEPEGTVVLWHQGSDPHASGALQGSRARIRCGN